MIYINTQIKKNPNVHIKKLFIYTLFIVIFLTFSFFLFMDHFNIFAFVGAVNGFDGLSKTFEVAAKAAGGLVQKTIEGYSYLGLSVIFFTGSAVCGGVYVYRRKNREKNASEKPKGDAGESLENQSNQTASTEVLTDNNTVVHSGNQQNTQIEGTEDVSSFLDSLDADTIVDGLLLGGCGGCLAASCLCIYRCVRILSDVYL